MKGGTGGQHIIDQQHRPAVNARYGLRRHGKGTGDIALPLMPAEPALASRRPLSDQQVRGEVTLSGVMAQMTGPFRRLIVALPEITPPMKWHRNDKRAVAGKLDEQTRAKAGQKWCQLQPVTMLVMKDQVARAVGIVETGADGGQWRRVCPASGAKRVGKCVAKRQAAPRAKWRGNRPQPLPAGGAQAGCVGESPAQDTLMRQQQRREVPGRHGEGRSGEARYGDGSGGRRHDSGPVHDAVSLDMARLIYP